MVLGVVATTPYVWIRRTGTHSACAPGDSQRTRRSQCRAFLVLYQKVVIDRIEAFAEIYKAQH